MHSLKLPAWLIVLVGAVYVFLHAPLLVLVLFSFNDSKFSVSWEGFTLRWYERLLERDDILEGLQASLVVGVTSTVFATVFGTLLALASLYPAVTQPSLGWPTRILLVIMHLLTWFLVVPQVARIVGDSEPGQHEDRDA